MTVNEAVFQVSLPVSVIVPAVWYGSPDPLSYCSATVPVPES